MNTDRSIQIKLSLGYLLLIAAVVFAIWYILKLTKELDKPQEMILVENNKVFQIGSLISDFYVSESTSRVALLTLNADDIARYHKKMDSLTQQTKEVRDVIEGDEIKSKLDSIVLMIDLKRDAFNQLVSTRSKYRQYASFDEALKKINQAKTQYSMAEDTQKYKPESLPKEGFFKRISNAFTSKNEKEREQAKREQQLQLQKSKIEGEAKLEKFRKTSEMILNDALKKENKKLESYLKQEEKLVQQNINFSNKIRDLVASVEHITNYKSQNIFTETNDKIEKVTKNLIRFGTITIVVILILALILIDDINKNYKYKKNLEKSNKNLEELIQQKNFFMAAITHDMNAPLNTLFGFTELLESSVQNEKLKNYVENIHHSATYFKSLVDDLSLFSKLEHQFLEINNHPFNFKELISKVYQQQLSIANKKNIDLQLHTDPNLDKYYYSDPHRITQILTNVVSNAIKFTNQGYVSIVANSKGEGVEIKVIDTGIGIQIQDKNELYKEFVQAHKEIEKSYGGTGLGLNITKRLIDMMGGTIDFESTLGHGTTFYIYLPLPIADGYDSDLEDETILIDPNKKLINKNILVIDDDLLQLQLLKEVLSGKVKSIDLLSDGRQLSQYLKNKKYQLIISDLQMPKYTGYQIIKEIRQIPDYQDTPVIAFSGKIDLNEKELKEMGFNAILRKPLNLKKLLLIIYRQLKIEYKLDLPLISVEHEEVKENIEEIVPSSEYQLTALYELLDGDKEAIKNILQVFLENATADLSEMKFAFENEDFGKVSQLAHKLLPMYRQLQIESQIPYLEKLERHIHELTTEERTALLEKTVSESIRILHAIKKIELD